MENFNNPHMNQWYDYTLKMLEAMKINNIEETDKYKQLADSEYEKYKEFADKMWSCQNFGMCNETFINVLPTLFKTNKKAVNAITNLIKEDKNLKAQYLFFNSLDNCTSDDTMSYIKESLDLLLTKIDVNTLQESNNKLISLIRKYEIINNDTITEDKKKLYENCDYLFKNKRTFNNLNQYTSTLSEVKNYIDKNKVLKENNINVFKLIEDYDKKYSEILTEEEKSFVQEIMDFKKNDKAHKKQAFFEKMKNECIKGVDKLLETCTANEKNDLLTIKEEIVNKTYCEETLVKDMAKLLELRDIILDK